MIYLDSSVALAHILKQERRPPTSFWLQPMTSSRLLEYEIRNRLHVYGETPHRRRRMREVLQRAELLEMTGDNLVRALRPFPRPVRTLDGLHLAAMDHLRERGVATTLASYDVRLLDAANAMGFANVQP